MRVVLFLGAGFSVPFGLPTMNQFFSFVMDNNRIGPPQKERLFQLRLEARKSSSFLESSATNLEDILSFAVMGRRLNLEAEAESKELSLGRILMRLFTSVSSVPDYWRQLDQFKRFLGFDLSPSGIHHLTIVTTNYDVLIESALARCQVGANLGFESLQPEVAGSSTGRLYGGEVPLFKLHGSVNWFEPTEPDGIVRVEDRIVSVGSGEHILPLVCTSNYSVSSEPMLIPPSFLKPEFYPVLRTAWSGAAAALRDADVLAFVGYSFPRSDTEMRYFLARSLVDNARLRRVLIFDKLAEDIVARLRLTESGFGGHFKEFLYSVPGNWTEQVLAGYL